MIVYQLFGELARVISNHLSDLRVTYKQIRPKKVFERYIAEALASAFLLTIVSIVVLLILNKYYSMNFLIYSIPLIIFLGVLVNYYVFPIIKRDSYKTQINGELTFALIHLNSLASSSISPLQIIELSSKNSDLKAFSREMRYAKNLIDITGEDPLTALKKTASSTASKKLAHFLFSFVNAFKSGANIQELLNIETKEKIMYYRLTLKEFSNKLSLYTAIYSTLIIAAPILFVILAILTSLFGNDIIPETELALIVGLPLLNIAYLLFIEVTQPK